MYRFILQALAVTLPAAALSPLTLAQHQHDAHSIDEIIITSSRDARRSATALPVSVLSGERLMQRASATLGETIRESLGVHSSSFGAGVGQPVIRGLAGNRVSVLQNSLPSLDAAGSSQDHASSVEALLADRIEIIRGPAALLYGDGAIGGVVNVIDSRVPKTLPAKLEGAVEVRARSVDSGRSALLRLDGAQNNIAWHFDGLIRRSSDYDIPGWAIQEHELRKLARSHDELDSDNRHGYVANSSTEAGSVTMGASLIGDRGFFGLALSHLENEYGLPLGTHSHSHHDDHDEDEDEHAHDHSDHRVRLDAEQSQISIEAGRQLDGFFSQMDLQLSWTRYEHREEEDQVSGTRYKSDGLNARMTFRHEDLGPWSGGIGFQAGDRNYSATGSEAFIPESDIRSFGIFALETLEAGNFLHEFGLRFNRQTIENQHCRRQDNTWNASVASIWNYRPDAQLSLSFNRSERAPSTEELYSNLAQESCSPRRDPARFVMHGSTARYELGNPRLKSEQSNNVDLAWHKHLGEIRAEVNLFYNDFDDFIYLSDVGEFEDNIISQYLQADAIFKGIEAQVMIPMDIGEHHVDLRLFGDFVHAKLRRGGYLPRIPPARAGFEVSYTTNAHWALRLRSTAVAKQRRAAEEELPTDSYLRVDAFFDYHLPIAADRELLFFARAENLTNEEIRDHSSFIKHYAPAPGRSLEVGLRYRF